MLTCTDTTFCSAPHGGWPVLHAEFLPLFVAYRLESSNHRMPLRVSRHAVDRIGLTSHHLCTQHISSARSTYLVTAMQIAYGMLSAVVNEYTKCTHIR